jgi:hypothetical protein
MYFKQHPWHGPKKISLNYSTSIFAIFDDFRVFWMEKWTLPHFSRGLRKSDSFLRQINGYLAMSTFRNRKYRRKPAMDKTGRVFANLNNELSFEINNHQLSHKIPLKITVWSSFRDLFLERWTYCAMKLSVHLILPTFELFGLPRYA